MKKLLAATILLLTSFLFAENYRIKNVNYTIEGCGWQIFSKTKAYALELNVPVDTQKTFDSKDKLDTYLLEYYQRLENTRAFEKIEINPIFNENDDFIETVLKVYVKDSFHLLAVPYPKYDSNTGFNLKLKAKDTNFLGSLNPLSTDIFLLLASAESDNKNNKVGFNFDFNYPFPIGKLRATWLNSDQFYYVFGSKMPEWNFKTGLSLCLPFDNYSFTWAFNQYCINNLDYEIFNDSLYFVENGSFSSSINLVTFKNNSTLVYSPSISTIFNWDNNGINIENSDLYGVTLSLAHSLSNSKIDWYNDFRNGYSASLNNTYSFNCQTLSFTPSVSFTGEYFTSFNISQLNKNGWEFFNYFGISSRIYSFYNFIKNDNFYNSTTGSNIGAYLRGIRDEQYYTDSGAGYLCQTNGAILLNLDFPLQIIKTNFPINLINFNMQFVPFIDVALIQNKYYKSSFNPKEGLYSAGLEVLVFPAKWKSMTVRGSCGFDLRRLLKKGTEMLSPNVSPWEITFGVGLFY